MGNPYAGTFKRNFEGDYRCTKESVNSMIRDSFHDAGDNEIIEVHTALIKKEILRELHQQAF